MIHSYFEEISVGDRNTTPARTITETDVVNFASLSGDWFPLHTDASYAESTFYGERIAHGMLVLSVVTGLITLTPGAVQAFHGIENLRFSRPTFIGDTIHAETEVTDARDRGEKGLVTSALTVKNQRGETVVTADFRWLVARGKTAPDA
ncbi:MAG: MaoC family dehydratase N-terminal domain-containing protein [Rubrobacter sp.]|nr:MaoC family dehydratase N-terminal domain-containing protein [Rubrobacter sp.]